ncbi:MAG: hypothetical protein KC553_07550 [Nitrospina sp.]|nr:hypothetical protein [Nitrospina sp.]
MKYFFDGNCSGIRLLKVARNLLLAAVIGGFFATGAQAEAPQACDTEKKKKVKIEGWINREHRKEYKAIVQEFKELPQTRARIKVFPMGDTAKVIGVGRCVPAYIARHAMEKALKYTGGVESLVNQAFLPPFWVGIGTTQFDEPSQQVINAEQLKALMNPELTDEEFQNLYREYSVQNATVPYFGSTPANVKKVD